MDKLEEMKRLAEQLNNAADAYYNGRGELMTDYEWDAMFDRLKQIEDETGIVLEESPTNRVSADQIAGQKEAHEFAALSLAKTKKPEDLVKWAEGRPIWISWKLDGLTLVATYDNGRLTKVVTRGDGHIGTNITHLAKAINGIPQTIPEQGHTVIRGEAVISYADFEAFNMESDEEYTNPRNLASGSLTLKNVDEVKKRNINWIPFTLVYSEHAMNSWGQRMQWLDDQGFRTVERRLIEHPDMGSVTEAIDLFTKQVTDRVNPYPVDGLVIAYDDTVYASTGSVTGHHATRAGYAFKWQDESAETVLDYIEWSCAASTITPVAVFAPVELEGTTVKRASLCNISECERLGIGESGTVLEVIKANKIIPKVIKVVKTEGVLNIPDVCPVCGASAEIYESPVSGTRTLRCTNPACTAKQLKKYTRFVSKQGMDIDGISEQTLARFINAGWIRSYGDVYRLPEHQTEIAEMDGFGEKSAQNLKDAVEKAKTVTDQKMLYALCIPLVGQDVAKRLLSAYPVNELISMAENAEQEDIFSSIDGIGPEKSASFVRWFKDADNAAVVRDLLSEITVKETERVEAGQLCQALTFVVTGDVYHYKNRNELKAYIESQGGKVTGSVSKSTSFLINNDIASTSGKNQKAIQLGIPIISEDEFIRRFTESGSEE
ncbi:MAG: NAD-dependent DNA ligase LigA [Solobacterium sp.]|nr:NAD-dependent DNA ligase LigA [Solobacterium sp.]